LRNTSQLVMQLRHRSPPTAAMFAAFQPRFDSPAIFIPCSNYERPRYRCDIGQGVVSGSDRRVPRPDRRLFGQLLLHPAFHPLCFIRWRKRRRADGKDVPELDANRFPRTLWFGRSKQPASKEAPTDTTAAASLPSHAQPDELMHAAADARSSLDLVERGAMARGSLNVKSVRTAHMQVATSPVAETPPVITHIVPYIILE